MHPANAGLATDVRNIDSTLERLYGVVAWPLATGLLQVAAIHRPSQRILALGPEAPASATDRFVLGFARARADALLTTGAILRAEPDLVHRYADDEAGDRAWAAWRRDRLGREDRPCLLVLSGSGRFRSDHPALATGHGWIFTTPAGRARIGEPPAGFEVVVDDGDAPAATAPQRAVADYEAVATRPTIVIEAGPRTASAFHPPAVNAPSTPTAPSTRPHRLVDELLLSSFDGAIAPSVAGPLFVARSRRFARFGAPVAHRRIDEPSGSWRFERYVAASERPAGGRRMAQRVGPSGISIASTTSNPKR